MTKPVFKVITDRPLGRLDAERLASWKKLLRRQRRAEKTGAKIGAEIRDFIADAETQFVAETGGAADGIGILASGLVVQTYCPCYRCQTLLHPLPAKDVVEGLVSLNALPEHVIPRARAWAVEADRRDPWSRRN